MKNSQRKRGRFEPNPMKSFLPIDQKEFSAKPKTSARASARPTVVVDTREQTPLDFSPFADRVDSVRATQYPGDYTIRGWESSWCVERKSLADLVGTVLESMRDDARGKVGRFRRELHEMSFFDFAVVGVTSPLQSLRLHKYRSAIEPSSVVGYIHALEAEYAVPFVFFANAFEMAEWIAGEAVHWSRNRKRVAQLTIPPPAVVISDKPNRKD